MFRTNPSREFQPETVNIEDLVPQDHLLTTTVVLTEKAIAFCNDKTETWLDVAFANKTKPKYESTEQLVAKGLFPGAVALPEPSRASQSPAAFECSQALEG